VAISSDHDPESTEESDGEYEFKHDANVDRCMEDNVDALYSVDFDGDVDMAWDGNNKEE